MPNLWVPSDEALLEDPVAAALVKNPAKAVDLGAQGVTIPDQTDTEINALDAAIVLADLSEKEKLDESTTETGESPDDDTVEDEHDPAHVDPAL